MNPNKIQYLITTCEAEMFNLLTELQKAKDKQTIVNILERYKKLKSELNTNPLWIMRDPSFNESKLIFQNYQKLDKFFSNLYAFLIEKLGSYEDITYHSAGNVGISQSKMEELFSFFTNG